MSLTRTVVVTRCPVGNVTEIAIEKNWLAEEYEKHGVELKLLHTLEKEHWEKHFTQEAPLSFREGGNIPPIWAQSQHIETKVIGLQFLPQTHAVIVRPDSAIRTIADLRGKRLALPRHVNARVDFWWATVKRAWKSVLDILDLTETDVTLTDVEVGNTYLHERQTDAEKYIFNNSNNGLNFQKEEIEALATGKVDAIYSYGGRVFDIQKKGLGRNIFDITQHPEATQVTNLYPNIVTVNAQFAEENPDLVTIFLTQLIRAGQWAKTHYKEVVDIFAGGTFTLPESFAASRDQDFHTELTPEISTEAIAALESQKDFLLKIRFIKNDFDVKSWIEPKYLQEAWRITTGAPASETASRT